MTTPKPGEFWKYDGVRVRIVGTLLNGHLVCEYRDGKTATLIHGDWWHHEPRCTGFDWVEPQSPDPGEGYELLANGTVLVRSDQVLQKNGWHSTCYPGERVGSRNGLEGPYRRKVTPTPEFCAMCGVHSVVPGTASCRECTEYAREATGCPVESPDDWVEITDPEHVLRECDFESHIKNTTDGWLSAVTLMSVGRKKSVELKVRCRRKDLPVPAIRRVPVRLWTMNDVIHWKSRWSVTAAQSDAGVSKNMVEIKHDENGFYVEVAE